MEAVKSNMNAVATPNCMASGNALMSDWLRWRALATPGKLAVLFEGRSLTYAELDQVADRQAAGLVHLGVCPGDRVAALMGNSIEAVALIHATARARAVLVPFNTRLAAVERTYQIDLVKPKLFVIDEQLEPGGGDGAVSSGKSEADYGLFVQNTLETISLTELGCLAEPFSGETLARRHTATAHKETILQSIIFTSGSSGAPKGVALSFDNHFWSATASSYRLGLDPDDRWLSCLPLYHAGGLAVVFRSCLYGTAIVLHRSFEFEEYRRSLREDSVTMASLVPTMLYRLLSTAPDIVWPDSLRAVLMGGAPTSKGLLDAAAKAVVRATPSYGLTETASQVATALPFDAQRKPGSVGKPLMFTEVRIADDSGRALPHDETGEILVRGPQVMSGYYGNAPATDKALRDGWLYTGDIGYLDADGDLFVLQRRSDMIVSGGENIYPAEVEAVLRGHPDVADACVIGLPDAEWGQRCAAAIQLRAGSTLDRDSLLSYSRTRLAGYMQPAPECICFVDTLPMSGPGKISRRAVETLLENARTGLQETTK